MQQQKESSDDQGMTTTHSKKLKRRRVADNLVVRGAIVTFLIYPGIYQPIQPAIPAWTWSVEAASWEQDTDLSLSKTDHSLQEAFHSTNNHRIQQNQIQKYEQRKEKQQWSRREVESVTGLRQQQRLSLSLINNDRGGSTLQLPSESSSTVNNLKKTTTTIVREMEAISIYDNNVSGENDSEVNTDKLARVVGGEPALDGVYPWYGQAAGQNLCGSTLIHPDIMLTAAHCIGAFVERGVGIGGIRIDGQDTKAYRVVDGEYQHYLYDNAMDLNDIMLLKLSEPVPDDVIQPIVLNYNANIPNPAGGELLTVIGFGYTSENGTSTGPATYSEILLEANVFNVDYDTCNALFQRIDNDMMICAGVEDGSRDSCRGDSGGPLLTQPDLEQVGIISFGIGCGRPNTPAVYTRVSNYQNWILDGICQLSSQPLDAATCQSVAGSFRSTTSSPSTSSTTTDTNTPNPTEQLPSSPFSLPTIGPTTEDEPTLAPTYGSFDNIPTAQPSILPSKLALPTMDPVATSTPSIAPIGVLPRPTQPIFKRPSVFQPTPTQPIYERPTFEPISPPVEQPTQKPRRVPIQTPIPVFQPTRPPVERPIRRPKPPTKPHKPKTRCPRPSMIKGRPPHKLSSKTMKKGDGKKSAKSSKGKGKKGKASPKDYVDHDNDSFLQTYENERERINGIFDRNNNEDADHRKKRQQNQWRWQNLFIPGTEFIIPKRNKNDTSELRERDVSMETVFSSYNRTSFDPLKDIVNNKDGEKHDKSTTIDVENSDVIESIRNATNALSLLSDQRSYP